MIMLIHPIYGVTQEAARKRGVFSKFKLLYVNFHTAHTVRPYRSDSDRNVYGGKDVVWSLG